ncbi:MAG: potassium-transporting ATPase subunit KdpC [Caulobacteraceae bacterium]
MLQHLRPAVVMMVLFTLLVGIAYPLAMTGVAGLAFPNQAGGSLVRDDKGAVIGSSLIAQAFARPEYLHPRPSAAGKGYDPMNSGGSNLGPMDGKLADRIKGDAAAITKADAKVVGGAAIPADAVTTSGSGLDPDVSPANARLQADRIAQNRGVATPEILAVIDTHQEGALLGFIGQPRVNVLAVNRALDASHPVAQSRVK